jgi:hypothetical protein
MSILWHDTDPANDTYRRFPRSLSDAFDEERYHSVYGPWHRETSWLAIAAYVVVVLGVCGSTLYVALWALGAW